jgi:hypothetical protein
MGQVGMAWVGKGHGGRVWLRMGRSGTSGSRTGRSQKKLQRSFLFLNGFRVGFVSVLFCFVYFRRDSKKTTKKKNF